MVWCAADRSRSRRLPRMLDRGDGRRARRHHRRCRGRVRHARVAVRATAAARADRRPLRPPKPGRSASGRRCRPIRRLRRGQGCSGVDAFALPGRQAPRTSSSDRVHRSGPRHAPRALSPRVGIRRSTSEPACVDKGQHCEAIRCCRARARLGLHGRGIGASAASAVPADPTIPGTTCPAFPYDNVSNTRQQAAGPPEQCDVARVDELVDDEAPSRLRARRGRGAAVRHSVGGGEPDDARCLVQLHVAVREQQGSVPDLILDPDRGRLGPPCPHGEPAPARCTSCSTPAPHGGPLHRRVGAISDLNSQRPATGRLDLRRRRGAADPARTRRLRPGGLRPAINHAIRVTVLHQRNYLWPARHQAGVANPSCPPMGARFRLKAGLHAAGVTVRGQLPDGARRHEALRADPGRQRQQLVLHRDLGRPLDRRPR